MRMHCIIHADFEQPGHFELWAREQNILVGKTKLHKGEELPSVKDFDILLSMGGPQSPLQMDKYPHLKDEVELIKQSVSTNKYVIGVCLGAQLIAERGSRGQVYI